MTAIFEQLTTEEYRTFIDRVADDHRADIEYDPLQVAVTLVASIEDVGEAFARTYGTVDYDERTVYPTDVLAHSEQTPSRVRHRANELFTVDYADAETITLAHAALVLDLEDAIDAQS